MVATGAKTTQPDNKAVCFRLHRQEFGLGIDQVKETLVMRPLTRVFLTPPWIAGVVNLRGDIVCILDLARLFGMEHTVITDSTRIVVVASGDLTAGILVDGLAELRTFDDDDIKAAPATLPGDTSDLLRGVVAVPGGALRLIDLDSLFEMESLRQYRREQ